MQFRDQVQRLANMGFKSFITVDYFFHFAKNEGKSVRELADGDNDEYQKSLRYFKLLSDGTKKEDGLELFETIQIVRQKVKEGRYPNVKAVKLTSKGRQLLRLLKPVKKSMKRVQRKAAP